MFRNLVNNYSFLKLVNSTNFLKLLPRNFQSRVYKRTPLTKKLHKTSENETKTLIYGINLELNKILDELFGSITHIQRRNENYEPLQNKKQSISFFSQSLFSIFLLHQTFSSKKIAINFFFSMFPF
jgi:hypothetical protein